MVPQTVSFELVVRFDRLESDKKPLTLAFESLEKMIQRYHKERKRRKLADRATSGKYRQILTDHGKEAIQDEACRKRHVDAINGTWFNM